MDAVEKIIKYLPKLNQKELRKLNSAVKFLLKDEKVESGWENVYALLCKEAKNRGINLPPKNVFRSYSNFKRFEEGIEVVEEFTETHFPRIDRVHKAKVQSLYCKILIDYLEESKMGVSMMGICLGYRDLPNLVNDAFPGYASAGLLMKIL